MHQIEQTGKTVPLGVRGCLALLACGVAFYLLRDHLPSVRLPLGQKGNPIRRCETTVNDRVLSDDFLGRLAATPVRSKRASVEALLGAPYCQLPTINARTDAKSERFLYKGTGDAPWLVVMYEGKEYTGFSFSSQGPQRGQ